MRHSTQSVLAIALVALTAAGCGDGGDEEVVIPEPSTALLNPGSDSASLTAPDLFKVKFETSKGDFVIEVHRDWAPNGADRFYYLVKNGFYDGVRFFRVIPEFIAQFGISPHPEVSAVWQDQTLPDDPVQQSNLRGFVTYAMAGPDSRTTQVFINYSDNSNLDEQGFAPFGQVIDGMEVVDSIYSGYGASGFVPDQKRIREEGNAYLDRAFPLLDYVKKATVMEQETPTSAQ
jgi:peptidyl-prolyl cis-trans isomerase A (cyclophilin A)